VIPTSARVTSSRFLASVFTGYAMSLGNSGSTSAAVSGRFGRVDGSHADSVPRSWYGSPGGGVGSGRISLTASTPGLALAAVGIKQRYRAIANPDLRWANLGFALSLMLASVGLAGFAVVQFRGHPYLVNRPGSIIAAEQATQVGRQISEVNKERLVIIQSLLCKSASSSAKVSPRPSPSPCVSVVSPLPSISPTVPSNGATPQPVNSQSEVAALGGLQREVKSLQSQLSKYQAQAGPRQTVVYAGGSDTVGLIAALAAVLTGLGTLAMGWAGLRPRPVPTEAGGVQASAPHRPAAQSPAPVPRVRLRRRRRGG
jgi:hypothetical protein